MRRRILLQVSLINITSATVTASSSIYDGTAKTPTVTVTLNGSTIPSTGYDVAYSNNTNAGTATITVTGKDGYTGTATGTFTIYHKSLSVTASAQTITYPNTISQSTSKVSTSGLVSGDSLTSITLTQSTTSPTTSGTITPSNAQTTKGISNYSVTYYTGNLTINKGTGAVSFGMTYCFMDYDGGSTGTIYVRAAASCGWVRTTEKTVSGYNVFRSVSNYNVHNSYSKMKLTFVNSTGAAISTTFKVGPATESSCDYVYITQWDAADVSSYSAPTNPLYTGSGKTATWTDVAVTIPTGTHTIQIVYRKDVSVHNSPDCGYVAIPYDVSFTSLLKNQPKYTGSGSFTWSSSSTSVATVNSSTGLVTIAGTGTTTITVSMASNTYYTSASASYTLTVNSFIPIGNVRNFGYTGSHQSLYLTPGTYKFQVWGAQGGSNAAYSTYGITAQSGGKGGYSEGQLTLTSARVFWIYVGGQGSSSAGGWNGGGSTSGTSQYNSGGTLGYSKMGGGGGATDIRLNDGALLSRMIVAGGGSGGAMCYKSVTSTTTTWETVTTLTNASWIWHSTDYAPGYDYSIYPMSSLENGKTYKLTISGVSGYSRIFYQDSSGWKIYSFNDTATSHTFTLDLTNYPPVSGADLRIRVSNESSTNSFTLQKQVTTSSTTTNNYSQVGFVGGGTSGGGTYPGTQTAGGNGAAFGAGKAMSTTGYRYCSGAGGGGWYGGGSAYSDSSTSYVGYSGGGSGWVNTSANAGNRPSGYNGLQLDSGTTYAGNTSFPSTSGSTETGHSGNGYAKITRLS